MNQALLEFIRETVTPENMKLQEPMAAHTTFRTGGEAAVFVEVPGKQQLTQLVQYMAKISQEFFVLGKGSNLLVGDKGYQGIVLNLGKRFARIEVEGNIIRAEAGASLPQVAVTAMQHGLSGLEFAAGIPGSIGGAIVMNAGAYDGENEAGNEMCYRFESDGRRNGSGL